MCKFLCPRYDFKIYELKLIYIIINGNRVNHPIVVLPLVGFPDERPLDHTSEGACSRREKVDVVI